MNSGSITTSDHSQRDGIRATTLILVAENQGSLCRHRPVFERIAKARRENGKRSELLPAVPSLRAIAPQNGRANYLLGQTLTELDRGNDAAPFLKRAEDLAALHELMRPIYFQAPTGQSLMKVAEAMDALGRNAEARAWYFAARASRRKILTTRLR